VDPYLIFLFTAFALWLIASPRDKVALYIVLWATLLSYFITEGVTRQIAGAWKLVIPGAVELATIAALLTWSRNRTGYMQVGLLVVAWGAHLLCYLDLVLNTDMVYSRYETILWGVSIGQLLAFYDTPIYHWHAYVQWRRDRAVSPARGGASLLHPESR